MGEKKYLAAILDNSIFKVNELGTNILYFQVTEKEKDFLIELAMQMNYEIVLRLLEEKE